MEELEAKKLKFTHFKITKELWSSTRLGANSKLLLGYLLMTKKRILYADTHYLGGISNLSKTTIANSLRELEDNYYISLYNKPGTRYNLTIIHDIAFKDFKYDMKKISENWHFIKDEKDKNKLIKRACACSETMYLFSEVYKKGENKNE